jgi:hypothetical protein
VRGYHVKAMLAMSIETGRPPDEAETTTGLVRPRAFSFRHSPYLSSA